MRYEHLLGIPFEHGVNDCYEIARRFFRDNFEIELTPYARPDNWWDHGLDLYRDHFRTEGFEIVEDPVHEARPADVFLVCIRSEVPNHCGIHLGDGKILHHLYGRRSEVVQFKGLWKNQLSCLVRHRDVPDLTPQATRVELMDLLPPHKRAKLEEILGRTA